MLTCPAAVAALELWMLCLRMPGAGTRQAEQNQQEETKKKSLAAGNEIKRAQ
jgi:hypothetical protein